MKKKQLVSESYIPVQTNEKFDEEVKSLVTAWWSSISLFLVSFWFLLEIGPKVWRNRRNPRHLSFSLETNEWTGIWFDFYTFLHSSLIFTKDHIVTAIWCWILFLSFRSLAYLLSLLMNEFLDGKYFFFQTVPSWVFLRYRN